MSGSHKKAEGEEVIGYRENQQTISAWAVETFGPPVHIYARITRVNLEWAEFLQSWNNKTPDAVEIADTAIVLMHSATAFGLDVNVIIYPWVGYDTNEDLPILVARAARIMSMLVQESLFENEALVRSGINKMSICLRDIATKLGHKLPQLIDDKMVINRKRQWSKGNHGYHKHVEVA